MMPPDEKQILVVVKVKEYYKKRIKYHRHKGKYIGNKKLWRRDRVVAQLPCTRPTWVYSSYPMWSPEPMRGDF